MHRWTLLAVWLLLGCDEDEPTSFDPATTTSTPKSKSGGGFSSDLAKSMGGSGSGSAEPDPVTPGSGAGSGSATSPGSGSGSTAVVAATGSGSASAMKPSSPSNDSAKAGSAVVAAGSASVTKAGSASAPPPINTSAPRVAVKPPADLAAIKISLSPNWDRDVGEAGTISLVVKVPGSNDTRVFSFRYGYEDTKAPTDRELYKKWLADNKFLKVDLDRQRGGAWYLQGVDGSGAPSFRVIVNYGGRKLICGGLLYKDAISNQLGDIRDKTIIQAKEICETLQL